MLNHREACARAEAEKRPEPVNVPGPRVEAEIIPGPVEAVVAPAAIERALAIYQQLNPRDHSVLVQARKILTRQIFGMVDLGEQDEQRLIVGGLARLKAIERDHAIKSAKCDRAIKAAGRVEKTTRDKTSPRRSKYG